MTDFVERIEQAITDLSRHGGRIVLRVGGVERSATFKAGLPRATVDRLLLRMIDKIELELTATQR